MYEAYTHKELFGTEITRVGIEPDGFRIRLSFFRVELGAATQSDLGPQQTEFSIERDSAMRIVSTLSSHLIGYEKEAKKTQWMDGPISYLIDLVNHQTYITIQQVGRPFIKMRLSRPRMLFIISSLALSYRVNRGEEL